MTERDTDGLIGRRRLLRLVAVGVGISLLEACGAPAAPSSSPATAAAGAIGSVAPSAGGAAAASGPVPPLKVAINAPSATYAHLYVAQSERFFGDAGVDVTITPAGVNSLNLLVANQVDLIVFGVGSALLTVKDGRESSILYGTLGNGVAGVMVGKKGVDDPAKIKRMGAGSIAQSSYGYAAYYKQRLGLSYDIVPFSDNNVMAAALTSGQIDGAVNTYLSFAPTIARGDAVVLIDTRDAATRKKYIGEDFPESGIVGLKPALAAKRESVTRFVRGVGMAQKFLASKSAQEVATSLRKAADLQSLTLDALTSQVTNTQPSYSPSSGYISEELWRFALSQYQYWGMAIDLTRPEYGYKERVDMSYYEAGIGKPPAR